VVVLESVLEPVGIQVPDSYLAVREPCGCKKPMFRREQEPGRPIVTSQDPLLSSLGVEDVDSAVFSAYGDYRCVGRCTHRRHGPGDFCKELIVTPNPPKPHLFALCVDQCAVVGEGGVDYARAFLVVPRGTQGIELPNFSTLLVGKQKHFTDWGELELQQG